MGLTSWLTAPSPPPLLQSPLSDVHFCFLFREKYPWRSRIWGRWRFLCAACWRDKDMEKVSAGFHNTSTERPSVYDNVYLIFIMNVCFYKTYYTYKENSKHRTNTGSLWTLCACGFVCATNHIIIIWLIIIWWFSDCIDFYSCSGFYLRVEPAEYSAWHIEHVVTLNSLLTRFYF